ncbi:MAG TPA: ABC transporter permease [Clostridia bacterium]|jgi:peptide/nickel transport system permease protein|nr:ABC transporter permease [Clostridiaceae bacterium]HOM35276.1 ABC transporter permease [Clostridia bacterium]HOT71315.1 ABC transporter permease [Clostridia bacterium]HQF99859.1 ABC transporter permease [Clostridia bacterium]HQH65334.1 ABC transporter permease [Clostridia bacterium]
MSRNNLPYDGGPENENRIDYIKEDDFTIRSSNIDEHISQSDSLDDEQRVKMLSPTMLVAKRFVRNRLAIIGLIIILAMFVFSFVGGWLHPYPETKIFYKKEVTSSQHATATINQNWYEEVKEGFEFTSINKAAFALALKDGKNIFTTKIDGKDVQFAIKELSADAVVLSETKRIGRIDIILGDYIFNQESDFVFSTAFKKAVLKAIDSKNSTIEFDGKEYFLELSKRECVIYTGQEQVVLTKNIYDMYEEGTRADFEIKYAAETALKAHVDTFKVNNKNYFIDYHEDTCTIYEVSGSEKIPFANISKLIVTPISADVFLSIDFKNAVEHAMYNNISSFTYTDDSGETVEYLVERHDLQWVIRTDKMTDLIDTYAFPSKEHPLGTDGSGMDILVRLMYGGRVSLTIGFVVVLIEIIIGVIIGGLSGYFGGWVDTLLMRLVEIFNCIPTMPIYIILGAALDTMKLDPSVRIYLLMIILGIFGWPGIARVVRGQILSLREQEFMIANEATGLSVYRRIFRHLVPNVIPQLIVFATMSLGGIILTEATLSFLNLGVKYPYASWGNIVNSVNDSYVLQNYWFVWIPAGMLILITVLGFNFVGDGLRDAFDPKMKR